MRVPSVSCDDTKILDVSNGEREDKKERAVKKCGNIEGRSAKICTNLAKSGSR